MKIRKVVAFVMSALMLCATFAFCCSAAEGGFSIDTDVLSPIKAALGEYLSIQNIIAVVIAGLGISLTFVLAWFGFRKVKSMIMQAASKGKLGG